jgi:pimeloyl-ACP methyl ester carboxylesterase
MRGRLKIAGGEIAYEVRGEGPAVLLLHAFPLGLVMWDDQVRALEATHEVVRFDCRGFGGSPPGEALLTMERVADDAAALLDHLEVSQAVVCGVSMGGYGAFAMVRRHPDRLRGLVLADTRAGPDNEDLRRLRSEQASKVLREGSGAIAEAFLPRLVGETTHKERPALVARLREIIVANPPRGIADALAGLAARGDSAPTLREVRVPTLLIWGAEDTLSPLAEAEKIKDGIAGSRLEVVPKAGHLSNMENPEAWNAALRTFLGTFPNTQRRSA